MIRLEKRELRKLLEENRDIIYQNDFFTMLKSDSLLEFRKCLQMVQEIQLTFSYKKR